MVVHPPDKIKKGREDLHGPFLIKKKTVGFRFAHGLCLSAMITGQFPLTHPSFRACHHQLLFSITQYVKIDFVMGVFPRILGTIPASFWVCQGFF
jgi:hypothetical protein